MTTVFFSYSHDDESFRDQLEKHLAMLKHQGLIEAWHDRRITPGANFDDAISQNLEAADIILLLVSSSFISSTYCFSREMVRAMERYEAGQAVVVPVIVRPCDWHHAPFGKLLAVPKDGKAISTWPNHDEAYTDVAKQVRYLLEQRGGRPKAPQQPAMLTAEAASPSLPRSSNLRLRKEFTDRDRSAFLHDSYEYIARFFEASLQELAQRNPGVEGSFRRIGASRFTAEVFRNGKRVSQCAIFLGGMGHDGIAFTYDAAASRNSFNEVLTAEADDQTLFFKALGMSHKGSTGQLSAEGAAELYWGMLLERLQ